MRKKSSLLFLIMAVSGLASLAFATRPGAPPSPPANTTPATTDIDKAMRLGMNYPHGPLAWADMIGLDAVLGVMIGLFGEWGDDHYRPSHLLRRMVAAGRLGRKTGQGFFNYAEE